MVSRRALPAVAVAWALLPAAAGAEKVVTTEGGVLEVESYEVDGEWVSLRLSGTGLMLLPLAKIDRVVDDAPASDGEGIQVLSEPFDLGFDGSEARPDAPFRHLIFETARRHGVSARLVAAMVEVESGFDPEAVSRKGARGLMQLMPATAERFGVSAARLFEPAENLEAGLRYLSFLIERFPGDLPRILAAYNAGEEQVDHHGGVPPFRETRDYVRRVTAALAGS